MKNDGNIAKNPFGELLRDEKLPSEIKKKVMSDIATIKCVIDMADLFVVKHPDLIIDALFSSCKEEKEEKKEDR